MDRGEWASLLKKMNEPKESQSVKSLNVPEHVLGMSEWPDGKLIDPSDDQLKLVGDIKKYHPELSTWDEMSIWDSWGWYSQDCLLVSTSECNCRHEWYLGYLYKVFSGVRVGSWYGDSETANEGYQELQILSGKS